MSDSILVLLLGNRPTALLISIWCRFHSRGLFKRGNAIDTSRGGAYSTYANKLDGSTIKQTAMQIDALSHATKTI